MSGPRVTDEAVEAALDVVMDDGHNGLDCRPGRNLGVTVQAALEAALPHLAPQVVEREAIAKAIHDAVWPNCPNEHVIFADGTEGDAADAVLALLNGGAS